MAQFKIFVSYNGVPVTRKHPCQFVEKDKANPLKNQQFAAENLGVRAEGESELHMQVQVG